MDVHAALIQPFAEFGFMRRALVACLALSIGGGPVGVLLVLRRMSLVGDALSHAVLPGVAIGFMIGGFSLVIMSLGGLIAGLVVAILSGLVARVTAQREDASFAAFYLISLALGVLIVSIQGSNIDLMHVLFGTILAVDDASLLLVVSIATLTLFTLAVIGRGLIVECFDPGFLRAVGGPSAAVHFVFLTLVVMNLVAGFHALGTLMAIGLMMLPAAAATIHVRSFAPLMSCRARRARPGQDIPTPGGRQAQSRYHLHHSRRHGEECRRGACRTQYAGRSGQRCPCLRTDPG